VPDIVFTKLNQHYEPAVGLARTILRSASLNLGSDSATGYAFLFDMNYVFEQFVRAALREALSSQPYRLPNRVPEILLDTAGRIPLRPDLCLLSQNRNIVWVGDVKYKRLPAVGYRHPDLYQLLAYLTALDLPGGMLIYAAEEGLHSADHVVSHADRRLRTIAINLSAPPAKILACIKEVAADIQVAATTETVRWRPFAEIAMA